MASTNHTTNYNLSQYVGTDKPTYLGDYNSDMSKIDNAIHGVSESVGTEQGRINLLETDRGTMANLQTTDKSSLVNAINEVNTNSNTNSTNIGSLASLNTTNKTTIVNAINEVLYDIMHKGFAHINIKAQTDQTSTGTAYKILENTTQTITTLGDALLVECFADVFNTGAGYLYDVGIKIDDTYYPVFTGAFQASNYMSATQIIENIPAGTHTISMYMKGQDASSAITLRHSYTYGYTVNEI